MSCARGQRRRCSSEPRTAGSFTGSREPASPRLALLSRRASTSTPSLLAHAAGACKHQSRDAELVALRSSGAGPADACVHDCDNVVRQTLTAAPMLGPPHAICVPCRLLPILRAKVGKHWIAQATLVLCLWKQCCCTSTRTSSSTDSDSRAAPAMQRSRARRRDE